MRMVDDPILLPLTAIDIVAFQLAQEEENDDGTDVSWGKHPTPRCALFVSRVPQADGGRQRTSSASTRSRSSIRACVR